MNNFINFAAAFSVRYAKKEEAMYLLPKPKRTKKREGFYEICWNTVITIDEALSEHGFVYAGILQECIRKSAGIECAILRGTKREGDIFLTLTPECGVQEYQMHIGPDGLVIAGGDGAAVLYGVQTLCQMIGQCGAVLECMEIDDAPDIGCRGYFLDETRGRVLTLPYLKKVADRLSRYKLNQFQLYVEHTYLFRDLTEMWRDETFDLGCEKSSDTAQRIGKEQMYIDYVRELCEFLDSRGKRVQFFGDIICRKPELIAQLPQGTICLTWGYAPGQPVDACRAMAQAGAVQYLCPGVSGWNQWMNLMEDSYQNIVRMCGYGREYHAEGILNTDWGDFGHINHPEFSVPGMIYGAAFSWNQEEIGFDAINRQISRLEYGDGTEQAVGIMAEMPAHSLFGWRDAVVNYEQMVHNHALPYEDLVPKLFREDSITADEMAKKADQALHRLVTQMKRAAVSMNESSRALAGLVELAAEAIRIWNQIGVSIVREKRGMAWEQEKAFALAGQLERWFMAYKGQWRSVGREGDLHHIAEIVFWYADCLRRRNAGFSK